ncbi:NTP transferase domain-containing protein [Chromobacterium sp. IIBBL 290-4]|uniref:nucleotidyltransferase family protein n=1 Tax=Chromobacterium sp. IIBBL 290-4 TaxID=2953890 RepID=UPI0020B88C43|nr:nucleotidyltransferase family protein [Chromobacterium sp. IIBBL 290-4]UTH76791.1 nucleotidyltransferase family protein [Chromobacterium sp. IIBBL 290-4]
MIVGVVLAAGQALRFGSDKRQARLPDGRTLLEASLASFIGQVQELALVLPADDLYGLAQCRTLGVRPLACRLNPAGMGHSLAYGAAWAMSLAGCQGMVLGLADMPAVQPHTVSQVAAALCHGKPVLPCHQGAPGHPRGLPAASFAKLLDLAGDVGAREAVDWSQALRLEVDDAGVLLDIDTQEDLKRLHGAAAAD